MEFKPYFLCAWVGYSVIFKTNLQKYLTEEFDTELVNIHLLLRTLQKSRNFIIAKVKSVI
jgi:hypothetical protein